MENELKELKTLVEDNNKILHKMQRAARWGRFFHLIYWALIVGSFGATYYFLQPFLEQALSVLGQVEGGINQLQDVGGGFKLPEGFDVNDFLEQIKKR